MTISARRLLGANVKDRNGEAVGQVRDVIFDSRVAGGACYVMILLVPETGRRAGRTIALPWSLLNVDPSLKVRAEPSLTLDLPRSALSRVKTASV